MLITLSKAEITTVLGEYAARLQGITGKCQTTVRFFHTVEDIVGVEIETKEVRDPLLAMAMEE